MVEEILHLKKGEGQSAGELISFLSILALVIAMPLLFSTITFNTWGLWKITVLRTAAVFLVLGLALHVWERRRLDWQNSPVDYQVLAFLFAAALATYFSVDLRKSLVGDYRQWEGLAAVMMYAGVFFISVNLLREDRKKKLLVITWSATACAAAVYGLVQQLGLDPIKWDYTFIESIRSASTFGSPLTFGTYLAMSLPIALSAAFTARRRPEKIVLAAVAAVIILALIFTYTRASWLAALLSIAVFFFLMPWDRRVKTLSAAVLTAGLIVIFILFASFNPAFSKRIDDTVGLNGGARIELWRITAKMIADRPLFGYGLNTFRLAFPKFRTPAQTRLERSIVEYDYPHNETLQIGAFTGLVGLTVYLVMIFSFLFFAGRAARRSEGERKLLRIGLFAASVAYLVSVQFSFGTVALSSLFWLLMGVQLADVADKTVSIDVKVLRSAAARVLTAAVLPILAALLLYLTVRPVLADYHFKRGFELQSNGKINEAVEEYRRAVSYNSAESFYLVGMGTAYYELALSGGPFAPARRSLAEKSYQAAVRQNPLDTMGRLQLADYYLGIGDNESAKGMLKTVKELDPLNQDVAKKLKELSK